MTGAVSFSLFGMKRRYIDGALENVALASTIYPGWEVVIHIERGHPLKKHLLMAGVTVVDHPPEPGRSGAFWRFQTICQRDRYDRVICRDIDSRINPREKAAVDDWIARGTALHTMAEFRSRHWRKISAGMFGVLTSATPWFGKALREWTDRARYRRDEEFLDHAVWPRLKHSHTGHRRYPQNENFLPFPDHPAYDGVVGARVIRGRENNRPVA